MHLSLPPVPTCLGNKPTCVSSVHSIIKFHSSNKQQQQQQQNLKKTSENEFFCIYQTRKKDICFLIVCVKGKSNRWGNKNQMSQFYFLYFYLFVFFTPTMPFCCGSTFCMPSIYKQPQGNRLPGDTVMDHHLCLSVPQKEWCSDWRSWRWRRFKNISGSMVIKLLHTVTCSIANWCKFASRMFWRSNTEWTWAVG